MYKYLVTCLLMVALAFAVSCSERRKADYEVQAELQLIDTLNQRLLTIRDWLDKMPLKEINERIEIIDNNIAFISDEMAEQKLAGDEETSHLLVEYKSYGMMYQKAADSFSNIVTRIEELIIQLKTLKESAYSKDYKKDIFLTYFHREKKEILDLYKYAAIVLKPLVDTDLSFERTEKQIEELAESLKGS